MNFLDPRLPERFWSKAIPEPNSGCWLWLNPRADGYGVMSVGRRGQGMHRAHVLAYETMRAPISDGLVIDHLCRERSCVNPAHMEPVTRGENVLRGVGYSGINKRKTHCPRGHEYDLVLKSGRSRWCWTCRRWQNAKRYNKP